MQGKAELRLAALGRVAALDELDAPRIGGSMAWHLGVRFTEVGPDYLQAHVPQPLVPGQHAHHLRAVSEGLVTATVRPLHTGKATQVWDIRIEDEAGRISCVSRLTVMTLGPR